MGWPVSEIGYGMWGLAGWTGSDDDETAAALERAVELGCNFFDTAWAYGNGHSEQLLGRLVRNHPEKELYVATKVPPKNFKWPSRREFTLDECFPPDHIREYAEKSLRNLDLPRIDLLQFHVWEDPWAHDERWQRAIEDLKRQGLIRAAGVSVNRWEPANVIETLRTGFDRRGSGHLQHLRPVARRTSCFLSAGSLNVAVIARVPFDEGTPHRQLDQDKPMAARRLAQQLFRAGKPRPERRPGRGPPAARARRDDDARARPALDPGRARRSRRSSRACARSSTSRPTSPPATAGRSTQACWSNSRRTAGTERRRIGRSERPR